MTKALSAAIATAAERRRCMIGTSEASLVEVPKAISEALEAVKLREFKSRISSMASRINRVIILVAYFSL